MNETDSKGRHASIWWLLCLAALATVALWIFIGDGWQEKLSIAGTSISLTALIVAVRIYFRQDRDSRESEERIGAKFTEGFSSLQQLALGPSSDDDQGPDPWAEEMKVIDSLATDGPGHRKARTLSASQIPLRVVADLVVGWEHAEKSGKWDVSSLIGASRRILGRGNPSWYVATRDPEDQRVVYWRLSKGGQSKAVPTVQEVTPS